jgi:hypothetical protein
MTTAELERRLTSLEREVAKLKRQLRVSSPPTKDWRRVVGIFKGDKDFRKMVRLGKQYRKRS